MMLSLAGRFSRRCVFGLGLGFLLALSSVTEVLADPSADAVAAMTVWLKGIDGGQYTQGWKASSLAFQKAEPEAAWEASVKAMRLPLGACLNRELVSAFYQTEVNTADGSALQGYFVVAKYSSNFANAKGVDETVTFTQTGAVWQASGYDVRSRVGGSF